MNKKWESYYTEETDEASSSDVSIPELSSQENKPETMYTTTKKKIIRDDVVSI